MRAGKSHLINGLLGLFVLVGIGGGSGNYLLVLAYRNAPAAVVAPFEYAKLIWASVFGWMLWQESPEPAVWIGAAIVAAAGIYITRREMTLGRRARETAGRDENRSPMISAIAKG